MDVVILFALGGPADPDVLAGKIKLDPRYLTCWKGEVISVYWEIYYKKFPVNVIPPKISILEKIKNYFK